ncbi:helix-turn-helix domain-containing protein [Streptomyces fimicarius]|uniref:helix-turn-helix domain-containing protein n=1 Tax=Streptomyces griseus TaxID=1911 RepID=UPI0036746482
MTTEPRPRPQVSDPTGRNVALNVRRIREARGWSTYDLARLLDQVGRPIAASAIAKVERAERRVDVGDLTALAVALRVNPSALLLPLDDAPAQTVEITGGGAVSGATAWDWADGLQPLVVTAENESTELLEFDLYARPARRRRERHPDSRALLASPEGRELLYRLSEEGRSGFVVNPKLLQEEQRQQREGGSDGPSVD